MLACNLRRLNANNPVTMANPETRLAEIQHRWATHRAEARRLSNERIRAINEAVDQGMTQGAVARAMGLPKYQVSKLLACGYPEDDDGVA